MPLKEATALYQRVHGTSGGSVYVAIAISENLRVAARIKGPKLSVRVEGVFSAQAKEALASQGIQFKGAAEASGYDYASGHYDCGLVPPERVVGAILFGCGLPFDTPIPNMQKVRELGKGGG